MACTTTACNDCKWWIVDNNNYQVCLNCKGTNLVTIFDEDGDYDEDDMVLDPDEEE